MEATIQLPSDRQEETHKKLLNLAQRLGHMMHLQEEQVQIDTAYEVMQNAAYGGFSGIIHNITRWEDAVSAPDCSCDRERVDEDPQRNHHNWEPGYLIKAYHTRTSSPKALALVEETEGGDLLLLPSTGGWEAAMSVIRAEGIIQDYPSMLVQPWRSSMG